MHLSRMVASWVGDLAGALIFAYFFTYLTESLAQEPFKSGVVELVVTDVVEPQCCDEDLPAFECCQTERVGLEMAVECRHDLRSDRAYGRADDLNQGPDAAQCESKICSSPSTVLAREFLIDPRQDGEDFALEKHSHF